VNGGKATDEGLSVAELVGRGFRLEGWTAEPSLNRLSRGDIAIRVEPKVMDVLTELAAHAGKVVPKEELIRAVWGREHLAESILTRAVAELRRHLEDDAHAPRFIETIPKRGYRLIAPVVFFADTVVDDDADLPPARWWRGASLLAAAAFVLGATLGWSALRPKRRRAGIAPRD
jgi:DNA-binding winged helix-turn-helix (wHTH) protein